MPEHFHFLQPLWLLALLPLAAILWRAIHSTSTDNPWRKIVDARLLPLLMNGQHQASGNTALWVLAAGWLLAVVALADPAWEQQPQPVMQTSTSRVIVFDLSRSMLATDIKPSRLASARFKVEDILRHNEEGQTGLVVFAGDAFTVSPLTRDADTILSLLKALDPAIMPVQGSRADLGLLKAAELLKQAGIQGGRILLIADGVEGNKTGQVAKQLRQDGYRVSVLGIGTPAGAPLPNSDPSVTPRIVKLEESALQAVATAGGGNYVRFSGNNSDINTLLSAAPERTGASHQSSDFLTQKWKENGPFLAVLLLPLAALAFRRGWLLSIVLLVGVIAQPQPAMALSWQDLWQRNDQQAARALQQQQYEQAATLADNPQQRGSAEYRKGDYQKAAEDFSQGQSADAAYNRGNALARLGKYQQAIDAYDDALAKNPVLEDAVANKTTIEELLKQQQNQKQDKQDSSDPQGEKKQPSEKQQSTDSNQSPEDSDGESGESPSEESQNSGEREGEQGDNPFADANQQLDKDGTEREGENQAEEPSQQALDEEDDDQQPRSAESEKQGEPEQNGTDSVPAAAQAEELSSEEQLAAQQWLRRIPDDPGGLLRRKFLYQYRQRAQQKHDGSTQNW